jgi:hypothetical protein
VLPHISDFNGACTHSAKTQAYNNALTYAHKHAFTHIQLPSRMLSCTLFHIHIGRSFIHLLIWTHDYRNEIFHERFHAGTIAQTLACKLVLRDVWENGTLKRCTYSEACEHLHSSVSENMHLVLGISAALSVHLLRSVFSIAL